MHDGETHTAATPSTSASSTSATTSSGGLGLKQRVIDKPRQLAGLERGARHALSIADGKEPPKNGLASAGPGNVRGMEGEHRLDAVLAILLLYGRQRDEA